MALISFRFPTRGEITHNMWGPDVNNALDVAGDHCNLAFTTPESVRRNPHP